LTDGALLPTEPELAEQFGVSRAVVRDATRILMAWGLVDVQHGRGVFVTPAQNEAFGEALLLALRRAGATVWDVEQFEQIILPEVLALAAVSATSEEVVEMRRLATAYLEAFAQHQARWWQKECPAAELEPLRAAYRAFIQAVFAATHNQVFSQLAGPLSKLRNLRHWAEGKGDTLETVNQIERAFLQQMVEAIAGGDPTQARATAARLFRLPPPAIEAMRRTPVGEIVDIPIAHQAESSS
jgi:DNA-binding FadR family transcriptional regulator